MALYNRYDPFTARAATAARGAQETLGITPRGEHIRDSQDALKAAHEEYKTAREALGDLTGDAARAAEERYAAAARNLNRAADRVGYAKGKIGKSLKGMGYSLAETLGADTSAWGSVRVRDSEQLVERALGARGSIFERMLSKPFRSAAKHPLLALVLGGTAATIGATKVLRGRAEAKTQEAIMNDAAGPVYKINDAAGPVYQTTPDDYAILMERMRGGQNNNDGFLEKMQRQRAAAEGQMAGAPSP